MVPLTGSEDGTSAENNLNSSANRDRVRLLEQTIMQLKTQLAESKIELQDSHGEASKVKTEVERLKTMMAQNERKFKNTEESHQA